MSRQATDAALLLGGLVQQGRKVKKWTIAELAQRGGVSVPTVRKVERGDPTVLIGTVFELATLVGVPLFTPDRHELSATARDVRERLTLLPERVHPPSKAVHDAF
jgi:transcriptional regulator with XRE-family HTH domain